MSFDVKRLLDSAILRSGDELDEKNVNQILDGSLRMGVKARSLSSELRVVLLSAVERTLPLMDEKARAHAFLT
jgi:hypothetical protein